MNALVQGNHQKRAVFALLLVAVLAALIQLGAIMTIIPGVGINAFAASVIFTMLAASSLDPRLLWDHSNDD